MTRWRLRLTLLGVGAMNSPRYAPAGLLVRYRRYRVMIDGGPGAAPSEPVDAWLVTDERNELRRELQELAAEHEVALQARDHGVRRLVFAHLGRPTLRAIDRGDLPSFGEWGRPGRTYWLPDPASATTAS